MSYLIAWIVAILATAGLAVLVYLPLRKKKLLALLLIAIGCFWALFPTSFEGGFVAPLFTVFVFTMFFEREASPETAIAVASIGTIGLLMVYCAVHLLHRAFGISPAKTWSNLRQRKKETIDSIEPKMSDDVAITPQVSSNLSDSEA